MANLNKVMLMGNLTRDPELSFLPNQTALCKIGLATNRRWTSQDGQQKEEVTFVDCTAFGRTAETIAKYLKKGRPLFIEGRLHYRQWDAQDGTKRSKLDVVIDSFEFIDSRPAAAPGAAGGNGGDTAAPAEGGGYQPRPQQQPRPAYRPPAGRPAPQQQQQPVPQDIEPPPPDDEAPPAIKDDDIPF